MNRLFIFDIDGTLLDISHRLKHIKKTPKDWKAFRDFGWTLYYLGNYKEAVQTFASEQIGRRRRDDYTDGAVRIPIQSAPQ